MTRPYAGLTAYGWAWDALLSPEEDRGTPHHVWTDLCDSSGFSPFVGAADRWTVSVPIGWSLHPDPRWGAVLRSVFGERLSAQEAVLWGHARHNGFRVVGRRRYPGGLQSMRDL